jgi:hypothetical protein
MFGTTLVYALGRAGVPVAELEADVDKLTRALAVRRLVRQHRCGCPATRTWLDEWLDEHADFPNVAHDDQVDVGPTPPGSRSRTGCRRRPPSRTAATPPHGRPTSSTSCKPSSR